jgi:hypothetical protein
VEVVVGDVEHVVVGLDLVVELIRFYDLLQRN